MTQKIKLIKPLHRLINSEQISVPEKFYGFKEKDVSFDFTLFYVENPGEKDLILNSRNERVVGPGVLSRLFLTARNCNVACAANEIENSLMEYIEQTPIIYMINLMEVKIKVELEDVWVYKHQLLIYHYGLE